MTPPDRIWLTGLMGAGKSTLGSALSLLTGWPHVDNDHELLAATGRPLAAWPPGEELHAAEDSLLALLALRDPPFIADVPAGTADRPSVLAALRGHGAVVVYLRAPATVLTARCFGTARPLGADPAATLRAQWTARDTAYAAAADLVVDATQSTARQADAVLDAFPLPLPQSRSRSRPPLP